MGKSQIFKILGLIALLFCCCLEPALANKFVTIGGGVAGNRSEKVMLLKDLVPFAGGFLILIGILALITRSRFEGLIGMVTGKRWEPITIVPLIMIIIGAILIGIYFL